MKREPSVSLRRSAAYGAVLRSIICTFPLAAVRSGIRDKVRPPRLQTRALLARIDSAGNRSVRTPPHTASASSIRSATDRVRDNTRARAIPDLPRIQLRCSPRECGWGAWSPTYPDEASHSASARSQSHQPPVLRTPARARRLLLAATRTGVRSFNPPHVNGPVILHLLHDANYETENGQTGRLRASIVSRT